MLSIYGVHVTFMIVTCAENLSSGTCPSTRTRARRPTNTPRNRRENYTVLLARRRLDVIADYRVLNYYLVSPLLTTLHPRSGELRTQKLKSHLVRTQSLNVLPFKPGVGQYIAIHATLTARDFFLAYFYPSSPFTCIFSKTSPNFFLCWPAE